jgi:hypothetical protein
MPKIVKALGRDRDSYAHVMPGTSPNLAGVDTTAGDQIAKEIRKAKRREANQAAKQAAAEQEAARAAEAAAAEARAAEAARLAAEREELAAEADEVGMTPEQLAEARLSNDQARADEQAAYDAAIADIEARRDHAERAAESAYNKGRDRVAARHEATLIQINAEEDQLTAAHRDAVARFDNEEARLGGTFTEQTDTPEDAIAADDSAAAEEAPTAPGWRDTLGADSAAGNTSNLLDRIEKQDYPRKKDGELSVASRKKMDADINRAAGVVSELDPDFWSTRARLDAIDDPAERAAQESAMRAARDELGRRTGRLIDERDGWDASEVESLRPYLGSVPADQPITTYDLLTDKEIPDRLDAARRASVTGSGLMDAASAGDPATAVKSALDGLPGDVDALDAAYVRINDDTPLRRGRAGNTRGVERSSHDREVLENAREFFADEDNASLTFHDDDRRAALAAVPAAYVAEMKADDAEKNAIDQHDAGRVRLNRSAYTPGGPGEFTTALAGDTPEDRDAAMAAADNIHFPDYVPESMTGRKRTGNSADARASRFTPTDTELGEIIDGAKTDLLVKFADAAEYTDPESSYYPTFDDDRDEEDFRRGTAAYRVGVREEFARRVDAAMADRNRWPEVVDFAESVDPNADVIDRDPEDLRTLLIREEIPGQESLFEV